MTDLLTAAKAALEALEELRSNSSTWAYGYHITELRTAIAEAEKAQPVAWIFDNYECLLPDQVEQEPFKSSPELYVPLYLHPASATPGWIRAVDEELVVCCIGIAESSDDYETARKKLHELIQWNIDVATNPAVNGGYKLIAREPTEEMLDVVTANHKKHPTVPDRWKGNMTRIFRAMWDTAPEVKPFEQRIDK